MKRMLIIIACCMLSMQQASAQWKKIADLVDTTTGEALQIDCVYFLDLPGSPSIGYTSAGPLFKTTDGGHSWSKCITGSGLFEDIFFNDSTTGWAVGYNNPVRTTDGGKTWQKLYLPIIAKAPNGNYYYPPSFAVYYSNYSKKLFLGLEDSVMLVSSDSGGSWQRTNILSVAGFVFSTPKDGILITNQVLDDSHHPFRWIDSLSHVYVTSDGGNSWRLGNQPFSWQYEIQQPLAIGGTSIYFQVGGIAYSGALGETMAVFRSDDSGMNWKKIYTFPDFVYTSKVIRGDLHSLVIQSNDSGVYHSTDEGLSWHRIYGPSDIAVRFYSKNGVTIASNYISSSQKADGLWEKIDPSSEVKTSRMSFDTISLYPNPTADGITLMGAENCRSFEVTDMLGRSYAIPSHNGTLDVSHLATGIYFVTDGRTRLKFVRK